MPANKSLHILLVNNYTARGGIPKAVSLLANAMTERGHKVTIYSQRPVPLWFYPLYRLGYFLYTRSLPEGKRPDIPKGTEKLQDMYPLRPDVTILPYNFTDKNLKIQRLRQEIRNLSPDVCVCPFPDGTHLVWAVTLLGSGIPYVYSERHSPGAIENIFWNRRGRLAAMSGADAIHLLLPSYAGSVPEFLRDRVRIIPNAVSLPDAAAKPGGRGAERKILLWMGRLQEELKQCCLAMDAFAAVSRQYSDWEMQIAGDGQDRAKVEAHAKALGLGEKIRFLGMSTNPEGVLSGAQAFCFSSRTEGMPNVLLEAMAAGLPCVAFRDCDGVPDIITDGETGLLADEMTPLSLAKELEKLLADDALRTRLGRNARTFMSAYSHAAVFDAWEKLLRSAAGKKGNTVMDSFQEEPFASMARMSARARQEYAGRDFGQPFPDALTVRLRAAVVRMKNAIRGICCKLHKGSGSRV
ncbi:glycosyltransferase [Desulfovibrio sp. ZJ369]|uniref:glycosyltransferase n=1 Tax=Desulfovibrio sp. ZJ369 TaxID=2709793 RepID=UPI0013ED3056|nr:glycosyltransferase [Desulfovibrio sp. ZJ369]